MSMLRLVTLLLVVDVVLIAADWLIPLEYSLSAEDSNYSPLGAISVERLFDGNYTARFMPSISSAALGQQMRKSLAEGHLYRVRTSSESDAAPIQGFNHPCLMLRAGLAHQFRLSVDADRHLVHSLALFPDNLFVAGPDYEQCTEHDVEDADIGTLTGSVVLNTIVDLPVPDTIAYIQKMEKERIARQHGAQQDNRSFVQKYWMYIAAGFIFLLISNAAAGEQSAE